MADPKVLIAGAGPTGLVLALWLTKLGVPLRIIDKTADAAPFSRALGVQARTLEFYRQLGQDPDLAGEMVQGGRKIVSINFWTRGRRAAHVPFGNLGEGLTPFPFLLVFPQDRHERLLLEQLDASGITVERQTELLRFDQHQQGVRAVLKGPNGLEDVCNVAYLAGCDGGRSSVRQGLAVDFPGGTYSRIFYVADVDASGPAIDGELHVELDEADLLAIFPMKGEGRVRLVGTVRATMIPKDRELNIDDVSTRAIERLKLTIASVNWFSTYQVHHRVANRFRSGRAFLLGDAAHIHSPVGGQGMNTGIGDAVNLAWKLAAVLHGRAAPDLLDTYEVERKAFARRLVETTDRVFTMASNRGRGAAFVRTAIVPRVLPWLMSQRPMRRFLFRTVSQLSINYRSSALSLGKAGAIRGGDRLPWVYDASTASNFAALTALEWQVHVYGTPDAGLADACAQLHLPLHVFEWKPEMRSTGLMRGAMYLVRPDGYVALADGRGDPRLLRHYLEERGLRTQLR